MSPWRILSSRILDLPTVSRKSSYRGAAVAVLPECISPIMGSLPRRFSPMLANNHTDIWPGTRAQIVKYNNLDPQSPASAGQINLTITNVFTSAALSTSGGVTNASTSAIPLKTVLLNILADALQFYETFW